MYRSKDLTTLPADFGSCDTYLYLNGPLSLALFLVYAVDQITFMTQNINDKHFLMLKIRTKRTHEFSSVALNSFLSRSFGVLLLSKFLLLYKFTKHSFILVQRKQQYN